MHGGHWVNFFGFKVIGAGDVVNKEDEDTDDIMRRSSVLMKMIFT